MKQFIFALALLSLASSSAHAGFWDFLFGADEDKAETPAAKPGEVLLKNLGQQLGVSKTQAQGGVGALLQLVQSNLKTEQFAQLKQSMPELQGLLAAAPKISKQSGTSTINGLLSQVGGLGKSVASLNTLKAQFDELGLDTKMIGQYGKIALDYYKSQDPETAQMIEQGLGLAEQFIQ